MKYKKFIFLAKSRIHNGDCISGKEYEGITTRKEILEEVKRLKGINIKGER